MTTPQKAQIFASLAVGFAIVSIIFSVIAIATRPSPPLAEPQIPELCVSGEARSALLQEYGQREAEAIIGEVCRDIPLR